MNNYDSDFLRDNFIKLNPDSDSKNRGFKPEDVGISEGISLDILSNQFHDMLWSFQRRFFSVIMKAEWLDRHIVFKGKTTPPNTWAQSGFPRSLVHKYFWHKYLGFGRAFLVNTFFRAIRSYADDLFPNFDDINALDYDFPFPFEHMKLECLFLVWKLPDRMIFLREGERKKMTIDEFENYLAAWMSNTTRLTGRQFEMPTNYFTYGPRYVHEAVPLRERLKRMSKK